MNFMDKPGTKNTTSDTGSGSGNPNLNPGSAGAPTGGNGNGESMAPSNVKKNVTAAGDALHKGIDKVSEPALNTVERLSTAAHETVDKIAATASHAADRFSDQTRFVSEAPHKALECSRSWVQDKPLEAIGAALAIGFILGRLTGR